MLRLQASYRPYRHCRAPVTRCNCLGTAQRTRGRRALASDLALQRPFYFLSCSTWKIVTWPTSPPRLLARQLVVTPLILPRDQLPVCHFLSLVQLRLRTSNQPTWPLTLPRPCPIAAPRPTPNQAPSRLDCGRDPARHPPCLPLSTSIAASGSSDVTQCPSLPFFYKPTALAKSKPFRQRPSRPSSHRPLSFRSS